MNDTSIKEVNWFFSGSWNFKMIFVFVLLRTCVETLFAANADMIDFHENAFLLEMPGIFTES